MKESREEKAERLINEMKQARGYIYPAWEYLARQDPDFAELFQQFYEPCFGDGKSLPAKYREFGPIALLAYKGNVEAVVQHMKRALRLGATKVELLDAVLTLLMPGGAPTLHAGLIVLMQLEKEGDS
ncbi:MAG: carboxymuconolactone decarboxylase family protein [Candidatus Tectomicrobia bacterium]|uniref:Carboxymuconolactone decarboxylase family protein n=1 Tax=Tectimicrobiota bacterium TaxID=2528274 RepID=A0A933LQF4_UNCTE|nr:carboxymuconolactone decarboxylase family protein [Candidatus Tectomicrobia bacterium]